MSPTCFPDPDPLPDRRPNNQPRENLFGWWDHRSDSASAISSYTNGMPPLYKNTTLPPGVPNPYYSMRRPYYPPVASHLYTKEDMYRREELVYAGRMEDEARAYAKRMEDPHRHGMEYPVGMGSTWRADERYPVGTGSTWQADEQYPGSIWRAGERGYRVRQGWRADCVEDIWVKSYGIDEQEEAEMQKAREEADMKKAREEAVQAAEQKRKKEEEDKAKEEKAKKAYEDYVERVRQQREAMKKFERERYLSPFKTKALEEEVKSRREAKKGEKGPKEGEKNKGEKDKRVSMSEDIEYIRVRRAGKGMEKGNERGKGSEWGCQMWKMRR